MVTFIVFLHDLFFLTSSYALRALYAYSKDSQLIEKIKLE